MLIRRPTGAVKPPIGARLDPSHPLASQLMAYWLFNENAGRPYDLVAGYNGALGTGHTWSSGVHGSALTGTASANISGTAQANAGLTLSIEAFYRVTADVDSNFFCQWGDTNGTRQVLHIADKYSEGVHVNGFGDDHLLDFGSKILGEWRHIVVTVDAANAIAVYRNGVLAATSAFGGTMNLDSTWRLMGCKFSDFQGEMQRLGMWRGRVLHLQEVRQLYTDPYQMVAKPLRRWWDVPAAAGGGDVALVPSALVIGQSVSRASTF